MNPIDNDYLKRALAIEERAYSDAKAAYEHHKDGENCSLVAALEDIMNDEREHISLIRQMIEMKRPDTDFAKYIGWKFGEESARQVMDAFDRIKLPPPVRGGHYLKSNEGCIAFLNKYAVVVRVEPKTPEKNYYARVNDSGSILQPLGSIDAGKAVIELCAGCRVERDESLIEHLKELLKDEGLVFSDPQLENIGRLDSDSPDFPGGVLLIIDRLAVSKMTKDVKIVENALVEKAKKEQERIFAPFRRAFREGLADESKMNIFWDLMERYALEGKFIAGWNEESDFFDKVGFFSKTSRAEEVARSYSNMFSEFEKRRAESEARFEEIMGRS
ncbi:MAG: hypothetical protein RQ824_11100 [bacterium]|nr:hypothetical protein [bacterium]